MGANCPRRVSAPSMMASAPSSTALATSVASARVGRGVSVMVSTTRVMTTGLPAWLHLCRTIFWERNTFSGGMSKPRLPRLKMTPSDAATMSSMCSSAESRSTLATMLTPPPPTDFAKSLHSCTARALGVKDSEMKSISFGTAQCSMTCLSHSLSVGKSSPLLLTCTVSNTPPSRAVFLHVQ